MHIGSLRERSDRKQSQSETWGVDHLASGTSNVLWILAWSSSCHELADTTSGADTLFGDLGEEFGAHDAGGAGEFSLAEDLEVALRQIVY